MMAKVDNPGKYQCWRCGRHTYYGKVSLSADGKWWNLLTTERLAFLQMENGGTHIQTAAFVKAPLLRRSHTGAPSKANGYNEARPT
jgi:hypothetical protein